MKAQSMEDCDYTLTITESPMLDSDLTVVKWIPSYWEVRNGAMGEHIIDAIRTNVLAPWQHADEHGEFEDVTEDTLQELDIPQVIIERMKQKKVL